MSIELLKAEWQNGDFFISDALLEKSLQEVENLLITWIELLNVDPRSLANAFVEDLGLT